MITYAQTIDERTHVVGRATGLQHPMLDEVSLSIGSVAYASFPYTVELAFFKQGGWVTDIVPEFAAYADSQAGDTRVYAYVPLLLAAQFIETWGKKN